MGAGRPSCCLVDYGTLCRLCPDRLRWQAVEAPRERFAGSTACHPHPSYGRERRRVSDRGNSIAGATRRQM